jgi:DNA-binding MarR family transcriptional regulator
MSSRKKPQSTRKVDTPEWAADVKPSEDVMAMFYAPTGQPKSGPLVPLSPPVPAPDVREDDVASDYISTVEDTSVKEQETSSEEYAGRVDEEDASALEVIENKVESADLSPETDLLKMNKPRSRPAQSKSASQGVVVNEALETPPAPETEGQTKTQRLETVHDNFDQNPPLTADPAVRAPRGAEFEKHFGDWRPFLTQGQISVLEALFDMTHALGHSDCFTSNARLATAAGISARQTSNILNDLERFGFIVRLETFNTRTKKGTILRLFLTRQMTPMNVTRRYHLIDE